jgi:acetyltransferase-like isoleucine patch superfamily enzyme
MDLYRLKIERILKDYRSEALFIRMKIFVFNFIKNMVSIIIKRMPKKIVKKIVVIYRWRESSLSFVIRNCCYKKLCMEYGDDNKISPGVYITDYERIRIGSCVKIHEFCILSGYGGIQIGNDVSIAHRCSILTSSHKYNEENKSINNTQLIKKSVTIGNNVWVGADVKVLLGCKIKDGVVIGAGSLVNTDLPKDTVCAGVPVKIIKKRFEDIKENIK